MALPNRFDPLAPDNGFGSGAGRFRAGPVDLQLVLSGDNLTLTVIISPTSDAYFDNSWSFIVYWIRGDRAVSAQDLMGQPFAYISSVSSFVFQTTGGSGSTISTDVNAKLYQSGWMYAVSVDSTGKIYPTSRTNFVLVPVPSATSAPANNVTAPSVSINPIGGANRLVLFTWTNPTALDTAKFMQIYINNYFIDGQFREGPIFPLNGSAGQVMQSYPFIVQTNPAPSQSMVLETDQVGAHNVTFYFVPLSGGYIPKTPISGNANILVAGGIS